MPFSKMKLAIAQVLKDAGFISDVERKKKNSTHGKKTEFEHLLLTLKYNDGEGAFQGVKIISKPSRRMYIKGSEIRPVRSGHGIAIISTSKGIMSSKDAWKQKLGGEILCEVW